MRKLLLLLALSAAPAYACTTGTQAFGYTDITAACNVQWDTFTVSPPTGNDGNKYDIYYRSVDGLNAANKRPILMALHDGAFMTTAASVGGGRVKFYSQFARDGWIVVVPSYTVNTLFQLSATLNPGDTTATITWSLFAVASTCAGFFHPAGQTGIVLNVGTDTLTVTGAFPVCDGGSHTVAVTRSNPNSTQANGTYAYIPNLGWPSMGQDVVGLLSFFAHCAPGGASYNAGTCAGQLTIAGDPHRISIWALSAGGQLTNLLVGKYNCINGLRCTLGVGGHTYTDTGWAIYNPGRAVPVVTLSPASNTGGVYAQDQITGTGTVQTSLAAVMMTGLGVPACPGGAGTFNQVTIVCSTPSTTYTASRALDVLALIQAGTPFPLPELVQSGSVDPDFSVYDPLLASQSGFFGHNYVGFAHEVDINLGTTPLNSVAFLEAEAVLGANRCPGAMTSGLMCPAGHPIAAGGVF